MSDVTIGVPVYNGATTIKECLDCLLNGSYQDIKIIVSDNASTDETVKIVEKIIQTDSRVSLFKQSENIGAVGNFRHVAEQAKTPFFAWRAHDDISDTHYVQHLRKALKSNEKASLVAPHTVTSKLKGEKQRPFKPELEGQDTAKANRLPKAEAGWFYGLYETEAAQRAAIFTHDNYPHVWGWDFVVIISAMLDGGVIGCNEARFIHRLHGPASNTYDFSKQQLRRIAVDFYQVGIKLAHERNMTGTELLLFKVRLWRLILRRVIRLQRLL